MVELATIACSIYAVSALGRLRDYYQRMACGERGREKSLGGWNEDFYWLLWVRDLRLNLAGGILDCGGILIDGEGM